MARRKIWIAVALAAAGGVGLWHARPDPAPLAPAVSLAQATRPVAPAPTPAAPPEPAPDAYVVKRVLPIERPFRHGDFMWDDAGIPDGAVVVTIDLAAQTLSVFRDGYEIGAAVILYGADEKPTPLGVFRVSEKDRDHVSNLYGAPMPYMLRLTNDGISIHGSDVGYGRATHGCIGVPNAFARRLFDAVRTGDRVIITRGERLDLGQAIGAA